MPYDYRDPALARVAARPEPDDWDPSEPVTLLEGAALLFPMGPITVNTLRRARLQGQLATRMVCNRLYTTIEAMRAMCLPEPNPLPEPPPVPAVTSPLPRNHPHTSEQADLLAELERRRAPKGWTKGRTKV